MKAELERRAPVLLIALPDDVAAILARYRDALAPGSVQVIGHGSDDHADQDLVTAMRVYGALGILPRPDPT